jgi:S1-C subfamily serine protease
MKVHIHVLYGIVVVLLALNIISFVMISSKTAQITASQDQLEENLIGELGEVRLENQASIDEVVRTIARQNDLIAKQQSDFEGEIEKLKSSSSGDFSSVIEDVIRGVVSVRTDKSTGTGFIIDEFGYIITNHHVIDGGSFVRIQMYDGSSFQVNIVGVDPSADIALLKGPEFSESLELADSDEVSIGEKVIAIGNPLGLSFTVTEGIVSATERLGPNGMNAYIQTDVTLNPGNSGGPLINKEGEVIGVNNFKLGGAEGLGFALESDVVMEVVNEINVAAGGQEIV